MPAPASAPATVSAIPSASASGNESENEIATANATVPATRKNKTADTTTRAEYPRILSLAADIRFTLRASVVGARVGKGPEGLSWGA